MQQRTNQTHLKNSTKEETNTQHNDNCWETFSHIIFDLEQALCGAKICLVPGDFSKVLPYVMVYYITLFVDKFFEYTILL